MFCPNCGAKNEDDSLFCEMCGSSLTEIEADGRMEEPVYSGGYAGGNYEQDLYQMPAAAKKPVSKWTLFLIAEILLAALAVYGIYVSGKKAFGPEKTAENYFVSVANGDWEKAYGMLDLEENQLINAEMFEKASVHNNIGTVSNYQVNPMGGINNLLQSDSSLGTSVSIEYRAQENADSSVYTVSLNKQAGKQFLLFDNWKVGAGSLVCEDYAVYVPAGASVSVDGLALTDDTKQADKKGYCYAKAEQDENASLTGYIIPRIFYGEHTIEVTMEDMEDVTETVQIEEGTQYTLDRMYMKQELLAELVKKAGENLQQIYGAAIKGKKFTAVKELFSTEQEVLQEAQESYEYLQESLLEGSSKAKKIRFYDLAASAYNTEASADISFAYEVDYTYEDWWSGDEKSDTHTGSSEAVFRFVKEDGNWVQTNLGCDTLYY